MKLKDKTVVITGASRGLGRALAARFGAEGARLALCARNGSLLTSLQASLQKSGCTVLASPCDVSNEVEVNAFARTVLEEFGSIDGVINNASILGRRVPLIDYDAKMWDEVVQTNLHGTFLVSKAFLPGMMSRGSGFVINVSSSVGRAGRKEWGAYSASKFGVEGLTQLLAEEVKPFNIRVNAVNPGPISTDMRRLAYPNEDQSLIRTPDQVTDVFVYLASQDGKGISGQSLDASTFVSNPGMLS